MAFSQLRPLGIGEILDGSFTLYRRHFVSMFLTALIPQIPLVVWSGIYGFWASGVSSLTGGIPTLGGGSGALLVAVLVLSPVVLLSTVVAFGAVVFQFSRAYTGTPVGTREALRRGMKQVLPLTAALIVAWLMVVMGFIFCVVPGIMAALACFAVVPAVVLERRGPIEAIERSFQLIRNAWLEVFLVVLVVWLITTLPGMAVGMLSLVGVVVAKGDPQAAAGIQAGTQVLSALVRTLTIPFSLGCTVLLYYDRRVRTEALDVQMMAESLNTPGGPGGEYPAGTGYAGGPALRRRPGVRRCGIRKSGVRSRLAIRQSRRGGLSRRPRISRRSRWPRLSGRDGFIRPRRSGRCGLRRPRIQSPGRDAGATRLPRRPCRRRAPGFGRRTPAAGGARPSRHAVGPGRRVSRPGCPRWIDPGAAWPRPGSATHLSVHGSIGRARSACGRGGGAAVSQTRFAGRSLDRPAGILPN